MSLSFYRVEMLMAVDVAEVRKYREGRYDWLPEEPTSWDSLDLARATCFGFVKKHDSRIIRIEATGPDSGDSVERRQSQGG